MKCQFFLVISSHFLKFHFIHFSTSFMKIQKILNFWNDFFVPKTAPFLPRPTTATTPGPRPCSPAQPAAPNPCPPTSSLAPPRFSQPTPSRWRPPATPRLLPLPPSVRPRPNALLSTNSLGSEGKRRKLPAFGILVEGRKFNLNFVCAASEALSFFPSLCCIL